jgi:protocatechuate 3,4-dioxygenase beta subunit
LKRVCLFDSWGWQKRPLSLAVSGHEPDFMTNMTSLAIRAALPVALLVVPPVAVHGVALQPQNVTTVIEGRVIRQGTSEPIPDTQMTLLRMNPGLPVTSNAITLMQTVATLMQSPDADTPGYIEGFLTPGAKTLNLAPELIRPLSHDVVLTDTEGSFSFKGLSPGRYLLTAQKEGYFDRLMGGYSGSTTTRILVIENGKPPAPLELSMIKAGTISGQIRDPAGRSVQGMKVDANQIWYPKGRATFSSRASAVTDEHGEFRLFWLPPGEYFVGATPGEVGSISNPQGTWALTFFPGETDPAAASPLTIREGEEIKGIDINLRTSTTRTYSISGTAVNPIASLNPVGRPGADRTVSSFYLVPRESSLTDGVLAPTVTNSLPVDSRKEGDFQIRNVKPGRYDLYPNAYDFTDHHILTSRTPIDVGNADITGLLIPVNKGVTLSAVATVEGEPPIPLNSLRMNLSTLDSTPYPFAASLESPQVDSSGRATAEGIPEARYTLGLTGLPPMAYIADIRQDDISVFDDGFVMDQKSRPVQIVVRSDGATVGGLVQTSDHKPAANITVILVPPLERRKNPALFKVVTTDEAGRFSMASVMPGPYTIIALKDPPFREPWLNADFLSTYKGLSFHVEIRSRSSEEVQLELIPN